MSRRLRVLVLTHKELYARDSIAGRSEAEVLPWRAEYQVVRGLEALGHRVEQLGLDTTLAPLHDLLDRFTGCNSEALVLTRDKAITKKLLHWHRIPIPEFQTFRRGRSRRRTDGLSYPMIVKPVDEGGSFGIRRESVVRNAEALQRSVRWVHERCGSDAVAERYIEGREVTVGLLGNRRPRCLPVWETHFDGLADGAPRIDTERLKWNMKHRRASAVHSGPACALPPGVSETVARLARRAWRILRLSGFARIDFRIDASGRPFLIDVNANPDVDFEEDFARSAAHAGLPPPALLQRLLDLGLRYRPHWLG
jgi:D-alanine-D-alanine ligase